MQRRQFIFWFSFGLFSLGERLRVGGLDRLAAATMHLADPKDASAKTTPPEHWTAAENNSWRWFERETWIGERWKLTGITTPIDKQTGQPYTGHKGYLDESLVPAELRRGEKLTTKDDDAGGEIEPAPHLPDPARRARHGRPPSRWLRSLDASELRVWLKTIDVPEADVSGMTFMIHLTRDHSFKAEKIEGLTNDEQAKLHAAAHHGY